jgi:hypothetical protein
MAESEPASGNILVYARVRDPVSRVQLIQLLDDTPGERISDNLYEVFTEDWDEGLWDQQIERMQSMIDPNIDTLIYWQAVDGKLLRTCVSGHAD